MFGSWRLEGINEPKALCRFVERLLGRGRWVVSFVIGCETQFRVEPKLDPSKITSRFRSLERMPVVKTENFRCQTQVSKWKPIQALDGPHSVEGLNAASATEAAPCAHLFSTTGVETMGHNRIAIRHAKTYHKYCLCYCAPNQLATNITAYYRWVISLTVRSLGQVVVVSPYVSIVFLN